MPKFKVHVQRYCEEIATIEIEAESLEDAVERANERVRYCDSTIQWTCGDDIETDDAAYCVHDENDEIAWERG